MSAAETTVDAIDPALLRGAPATVIKRLSEALLAERALRRTLRESFERRPDPDAALARQIEDMRRASDHRRWQLERANAAIMSLSLRLAEAEAQVRDRETEDYADALARERERTGVAT